MRLRSYGKNWFIDENLCNIKRYLLHLQIIVSDSILYENCTELKESLVESCIK